MLTKLICRNFKNFGEVEIELGNPVVFIGPNNSGKTTALQALALWEIGLKRWNEKRKGRANPEKRPGVAINRRDLISIPVPSARLLWWNLQVRDTERVDGKQRTQNIRIDIIVEGVTASRAWQCGLEFDYANEESFYCVLSENQRKMVKWWSKCLCQRKHRVFLLLFFHQCLDLLRMKRDLMKARSMFESERDVRQRFYVISAIRFQGILKPGRNFVVRYDRCLVYNLIDQITLQSEARLQ